MDDTCLRFTSLLAEVKNFNLFIKKSFYLVLLLLIGGQLLAQELPIRILPQNSGDIIELHFENDQLFTKDSIEKKITYKLDSLRQVGYLAASIDSISNKNEAWVVQLYLGKQYKPGKIVNGNIDNEIYTPSVKW